MTEPRIYPCFAVRSRHDHNRFACGYCPSFASAQETYYRQWRAADGNIPFEIVYIPEYGGEVKVIDPVSGKADETA